MIPPHARDIFAIFLRKRRATILRRLRSQIAAAPEFQGAYHLTQAPSSWTVFATLLDMLSQNIADPVDRRCFTYFREAVIPKLTPEVALPQLNRLIGLYQRIVTQLVHKSFGPAIGHEGSPDVRHFLELLERQCAELEHTSAESPHQTEQSLSEAKYYALFENASEAILSFRPGDGRIIEINMQGERLLGRSRLDLLGVPFVELFATEYRDQAQWLVAQPGGTSNMRLEDMAVRRGDGLFIPISLSCNWVNVEGSALAQVIMRDVTQLRQMQRELQSYAEQLEARVAARTRDLQQSEERFRALFLQEQRRAQHLSLINDVQQCALVTSDIDEFMHQAAAAVQLHFRDCDVTFYMCRSTRPETSTGLSEATSSRLDTESDFELESHGDYPATLSESRFSTPNVALPEPEPEPVAADDTMGCTELLVTAQLGGHGLAQPVGSTHPVDSGLPGYAATHGDLLNVSNDTLNDPRYQRPEGVHRDARSQMCVPVSIEGRILGVISILSAHKDTFDPRDAVAVQTAATIVASHMQAMRVLQEMSDLQEFNETLIGTILHSLMVANRNGLIQLANERLNQTLRVARSELINQPISRVFGEHGMERFGIDEAINSVLINGTAREIPEVHIWTRDAEFVFDLRLSRVYFRGEPHVVILLINLTQRWRKTQQLQLMNEMGRFLQASLDINRVLHTVLTCITAGPALGFNRAFLLLFNEDNSILKGAMALGPSSAEEASLIWSEMGRRELSLQDIIVDETGFDPQHPTPLLQEQILRLSVSFGTEPAGVLARAVDERRALRVTRDELIGNGGGTLDARNLRVAQELFTAPEVALAPLVAKSRIVGLVIADNLYSSAPIDSDDVQMLETVAQQAGLTVDNALTYQALQKAQQELVSAERLVAVGEMAARVSHEIRNPLATIGGWAHSVLKKPDDSDGVRRKLGIIVEEVGRLEELLSDLLDMARARELEFEPQSLNEIVEHALLLADADIRATGVEVEKHLGSDIPIGLFDRRRLLQALLNTLRNGAQSMPEGGVLTISTRYICKSDIAEPDIGGQKPAPRQSMVEIEIKDQGVGIPERALKQVFDPFFSTKIRGSGLGLAITLRIIRDHGGTIDVLSEEGQGTTFIMTLPLREADATSAQSDDSANYEGTGSPAQGPDFTLAQVSASNGSTENGSTENGNTMSQTAEGLQENRSV